MTVPMKHANNDPSLTGNSHKECKNSKNTINFLVKNPFTLTWQRSTIPTFWKWVFFRTIFIFFSYRLPLYASPLTSFLPVANVEKSRKRRSLPSLMRLRAGRSSFCRAHVLRRRSARQKGCDLVRRTLWQGSGHAFFDHSPDC